MTKDPKPLASSYRAILTPLRRNVESVRESANNKPVFYSIDIHATIDRSVEFLNKLIEETKPPEKVRIACREAMKVGKEALEVVNDNNDSFLLRNPSYVACLEVIVRTDGSRPSFLIKDGKVDLDSSPAGRWYSVIDKKQDIISETISSVGRIDVDGVPVGTGFLIAKDLIITNRHVLQAIATKENDGNWLLMSGASIDFGYEFRSKPSWNKRDLKKVIFAGASYIDPETIDHSRLDLAVIQLYGDGFVMKPLKFDSSTDWSAPGSYVYTIGYPSNPGLAGLVNYGQLLEELFKGTFDHKRLAPGMVLSEEHQVAGKLLHDATTLGGNSGSVIFVVGREDVAAGVHYGGTLRPPRQNWGHLLGGALKQKDKEGVTLEERLAPFNLTFFDRHNNKN